VVSPLPRGAQRGAAQIAERILAFNGGIHAAVLTPDSEVPRHVVIDLVSYWLRLSRSNPLTP
jgi:hypothetical protein